jgi:hypothetical protein
MGDSIARAEIDSREKYRNRTLTDPVELARAHPYMAAEDIDLDILEEYYRRELIPARLRPGWMTLECMLSGAGMGTSIRTAGRLLEEAKQRSAPTGPSPNDGLWSSAAIASAHVPAFSNRLHYGMVHPDTAETVYRELVLEVLSLSARLGDKAEAIVSALGARAAMLDDPDKFLYPTSPREGASDLRGSNGATYNHDGYRLKPTENAIAKGALIEVKMGPNDVAKRYGPGIVVVRCIRDFGPIVLGEEADVLQPWSEVARALSTEFAERTTEAMMTELETGVRSPMLDAMDTALEDLIRHASPVQRPPLL